MAFPIDAVFLDKELRVRAVVRGDASLARGVEAGLAQRPRAGRPARPARVGIEKEADFRGMISRDAISPNSGC